jgi:YidC/Oxa1 family membrane protein insertase
VRRFPILLGVPLLVLIVAWGAVWASQKELTYQITERNGYKEIEVRTALASYVFSEDGGALKSLFLHFAPWGSALVELVPGTRTDPDGWERQYVADTHFPFAIDTEQTRDQGVTAEEAIPGEPSTWIYELSEPQEVSSDELVVTFRGNLENLSVVKQFTIRNDPYYTIDVTIEVENASETPMELWMTLGDYLPKEKGPSLVFQFDGESGESVLAPGSYASFDGLGLMDKASVFFLKSRSAADVAPFKERTPAGNWHFGVKISSEQGSPKVAFSLYGGRRRYLLMEPVGLGTLDNPGAGARMMIPLIQFLELLYRYTGNYGWAIILFTLLTRIVLFPLMRKQFHSMAKMQRLQPSLKKIQERFKGDRQLMQQKLMELYRKEGINPLSGCFPLLLQFPILILLWKAILYSGEQIHLSPGFLWLPDLSLQDPYYILIIVTTLLMILQQWLMTPTPGGESGGNQKLFGYLMPIVLAVFLYRFPAGLWLYYFLTTIFQVGQQAFVNWELARAGGAGGIAELSPIEEAEASEEDDGNRDDQAGD